MPPGPSTNSHEPLVRVAENKEGRSRGVTPVILLILAVLWIAVLAPGFLKKRAERRSVGSIDSFHHELHLLEQQTGPKIVSPAYRLGDATVNGTRGLPAISSMPGRPKLTLLGKPGDPSGYASAAGYDDNALSGPEVQPGAVPAGEPWEKGHMSTLRAVPGSATPGGRRPDAYQRRQAAKRRRDIFFGLVATFVFTGLLGMVHSLRLLWAITLISGLAIAAYVYLMVYARQLTMQKRAAPRARPSRPAAFRPTVPASAASTTARRAVPTDQRSRDELARYRAASRVDETAELRIAVR